MMGFASLNPSYSTTALPSARAIQLAQADTLPPVGIEIVRREPALERGLAGGPFGIARREPGGVVVAPLDDHVVAEDALEREAEAQCRAARGGVERVAFPFVAP